MNESTEDGGFLPVFGTDLMEELPAAEVLGMTPKTNSGGANGECF